MLPGAALLGLLLAAPQAGGAGDRRQQPAMTRHLLGLADCGGERCQASVPAGPELCSLEGGEEVDPACPEPDLPSGIQRGPLCHQGRVMEAERAQPAGVPRSQGVA